MKRTLFIMLISFLYISTNAQSLNVMYNLSNHAGFNISCHSASDGIIDASIVGGTPPYTFSCSNNSTSLYLDSLSAGSRTIMINYIL